MLHIRKTSYRIPHLMTFTYFASATYVLRAQFLCILMLLSDIYAGDACTGDVVMFEQNVYEM